METKLEAMLAAEEIPVSSDFIETLVEQRVGPGILLLSPELKLMHMNRQAWELSRKITQAQNGKAATGVLPPAVTQLCAEVITALRVRIDAKDWEQVQITRLVSPPNPPVLLRAFGFPDGGEAQRARIFILMEEVAHRKERGTEKARERFGLTACYSRELARSVRTSGGSPFLHQAPLRGPHPVVLHNKIALF